MPKASADRISRMGEDDWRIKVVGAPGLDQIIHEKRLTRIQIFDKLGLKSIVILVLQHSVSTEVDLARLSNE